MSRPAFQYSWRDLMQRVLAHRRELILANLIAVGATLAAVPVPLLLPVLVDEVLLGQPGPVVPAIQALLPEGWGRPAVYIGLMVLCALGLRLLSLALNVWQTRQFTRISKDIVYRMRTRLLDHMGRVAMREYEQLGSGAVASRFITDINTLDEFLGTTISRLVVALLTILGTAAILIWVHWKLALLILLLNPVVILMATRIGRRVKALKKAENQATERFQGVLTETLDAMAQLRAANREPHYLKRLAGLAREVRDHATRYHWKSDAASRFSFTVFQFGIDVFRAAAMLTVLYSDLSVGYMLAVFGYLWFMLLPVQEIINMQYKLFAARAALQRINGLLALQPEPVWPHRQNPFEGQKTVSVTVDHLSFAYDDAPILKDVSLHIAAGEKVALVGVSGGGKSTLVQLLLGLYSPDSGTIAYGGVPVEDIGLDVVRQHVATVLQHPALFNDSVRANLTLGRDLPDEALWQALEVAQLADTVRAMPDGLETQVGQHGVRLSGGQRQRLAIARMILSDPKVVILDEATSALDAETEYRLHRALDTFLQGRTTLIIAHRLSAVKQARRAYVFEDGYVVEEGHHDELLRRNGLYAQLYGDRQH